MKPLENLIKQTGLSPYSFALKHKLPNIYNKMQNENYSILKIIQLARKEGITEVRGFVNDCHVIIQIGD